jgi:hypothetical protein
MAKRRARGRSQGFEIRPRFEHGDRSHERRLTRAATKLSQDAFTEVWDNPDDADYDRL